MENNEKVSDSVITRILFTYTTEDSTKHIRQVVISEAWDGYGRWNGTFNFQVTTDKYSTFYADLGLNYFGEIYRQLKEDSVDEIVLNTLEEIVSSYLPEPEQEEEEEVGGEDPVEMVKKHE